MKNRANIFIKRVFKFIKNRLYVNETLILFVHEEHISQDTSANITYITSQNVRDVLEFQHPRYLSVFERFLQRGDTGYFAYLNGKCIHRSWVVHTPQTVHLHPMLPRQLSADEAFIHYCETAPSGRGKNIYPAVLSKIAYDFKKSFRVLMISANAKNSSSIKGIKKAGFTERERERENNSAARNQIQKALQIIIITMGISPIVEPLLLSRHNIVGIIECAPRLGNTTNGDNLAYRIGQRINNWVRKKPLNLRSLATKKNIPYYFMNAGSSKDLEEWVTSLHPDLIVVFSMSQLLKKNIFSIPEYGTINLHPSMLPKYRGPNPWFWMYHDCDLQPGVTVHYIDEGEDTGDIIYQEDFDISLGTPFHDAYQKAIGAIGTNLLIRAIDDISVKSAPRLTQRQESPTKRARNVHPDEANNLISWDKWPVWRVWHFLRGAAHWMNILPDMRGIYKGQRWEIGEYVSSPMDRSKYTVGRTYLQDGRTFLACKDGKIFINKKFNLKRFIICRLLS